MTSTTAESPAASAPAAPAPELLDTGVLVIGGGPACTTAATAPARKGWRVTLLEKKEYAPALFHIGESLLPMNLPILERLGALRMTPQALHGWWRRRRQVGVAFSGDTLQRGNP